MGMKASDVLPHVKAEHLTPKQKKTLKAKLLAHKKHLEKSIEAVDKALKKL
jgi:hypothetical protein